MICDALLVSLWVAIGLERRSEMDWASVFQLGWVCIFSLPLEYPQPIRHISLAGAALVEAGTLVHILHGIGLVIGDRAEQGQSLFHTLARGWRTPRLAAKHAQYSSAGRGHSLSSKSPPPGHVRACPCFLRIGVDM